MSPHQAVCHLADAFRVALGRMSVSSNVNAFHRTVVKTFALRAPLPWPPGIPTRPELDQARGRGTRPSEFAADVRELEALIESFTAPSRTIDRQPHPMFGAMTDADWLRWGYLH